MRIFSKKAYGFIKPGADKLDKTAGIMVPEVVRTTTGDFQDVPDWCSDDQMFKWAQADGDIEIIQVTPFVAGKAAKADTEKTA